MGEAMDCPKGRLESSFMNTFIDSTNEGRGVLDVHAEFHEVGWKGI